MSRSPNSGEGCPDLVMARTDPISASTSARAVDNRSCQLSQIPARDKSEDRPGEPPLNYRVTRGTPICALEGRAIFAASPGDVPGPSRYCGAQERDNLPDSRPNTLKPTIAVTGTPPVIVFRVVFGWAGAERAPRMTPCERFRSQARAEENRPPAVGAVTRAHWGRDTKWRLSRRPAAS